MAVVAVAELPGYLARGERLLGIDLGSRRIGVALSDPGLILASPLATVVRTRFGRDAEALESLLERHRAGGIVLGLPVSMDGREGPRCQSTRQFAANLLARRDRPLAFQDERLSTRAVERVLVGEADLSRRRRARVVDRLAAAWILQGALDRIAGGPAAGAAAGAAAALAPDRGDA